MNRITDKEVEDITSHLLPSLSFPHSLAHLLLINPEYTIQSSLWAFHKRQDRIVGILNYDERDSYWTLWGNHPDDVLPILDEVLGEKQLDTLDFNGQRWEEKRMKDKIYTHLFGRIDEAIAPALRTYAAKRSRKIIGDSPYDAWIVQNPKNIPPIKRELGPNVTIDPLTENEAEFVDSLWTYKSSISLNIARECIQKRPSLCIRPVSVDQEDYNNSTDHHNKNNNPIVKNKPLSWGLLRTDYSIGMLHTVEGARGQGYGKRLVRDLTEIVANTPLEYPKSTTDDRDRIGLRYAHPFDFIAPGNEASEGLHKDLGYEKNVQHYWIRI